MKHDIITGDCLDVLPTLPARSVNLVCSSPPYPGQMGNWQTVAEWLDWLGHVARRLRPVLAPSAVVALNVAFKRTADGWQDTRLWAGVASALEAAELRCLDVYIWHKTNGAQNGPSTYADAPGYEPVFVYTNAERPGDLLGDNKVAVTGTMELDGSVGEVGGIAQKAVAARRAGAKYFLVPRSLENEAKRNAGSMKVIPVSNLAEALDALASIGGNARELTLQTTPKAK